jgi:hypothetical protein
MSFDQYYEAKTLPDAQSEGSIVVAGFDSIGFALIKSEAAKIVARQGKGQKRQKKKDDKPRAKNIRRLAGLERLKQEVFHEIMNHNRNRDHESKKPLVVVMDGSLGLWSILMTFLSVIAFTGILDIIHVTHQLFA